MPTKTKTRNKAKADKRRSWCSAERYMRECLAHDKKIKNIDDDDGVLAYLKLLGSHPQEDPRQPLELRVQKRLEKELNTA